jgi:hypothetical protein
MLFIALLLLGFVAFWLLPEFAAAVTTGDIPFSLFNRPSLTGRRQILYRRLAVMYPKHVIFTQVALSQLTDIIPGAPEYLSLGTHLKGRVADFVLCRRDFSIVAVIELDDGNRAARPVEGAEALGSEAANSAAPRLVRIGPSPIPSQSQLQQMLGEKMDPPSP